MMSSAISSFQEAFDIKGEVGRLIDIATSETLLGADWQQNLQICDKINAGGKEAAKDAVRSLRKRMKHKNPKVQLLSLSVLEAAVKNCGPELLMQVASKDLMGDLQAFVLQPDVELGVQRKVLQLVQAWGEAFKDTREDMPLFYETYSALKSQGIRFPEYDPTLAPTGRPQDRMSAGAGGMSVQRGGSGGQGGADFGGRNQQPPREAAPATFDSEKLFSDLEQVKMQTTLLSDMLGEVNGKSEDVADNKLLSELVRNCRVFNQRIMKLVEQVQEDDIIPHLVSVNEELIKALELYDDKAKEYLGNRPG
eukprot:CAMPEP_0181324014 /NCGR_PEP_ID=MMETSP1101-20121128/20113_1 /TAXON_ID=46948 /ORGANISM="Rhodomonas abbreviata, Strain Caron Lab Isolate" /LENGTH=307 /DNA_ID=CAMNT_0023432121 /DNA_START=106 /DNA_END=1026 /DNA_ORIENTATION=-